MKKIGQVIMLSTNGESPLHYKYDEGYKYAPDLGFDLFNSSRNFQHKPHHLYITDDSVIKEGDIILTDERMVKQDSPIYSVEKCIKVENDWIFGSINNEDVGHNANFTKKIIASTDPNLSLPLIPQEFLIKYCANPVKEVEVEYEYGKTEEWLKGEKDNQLFEVKDFTILQTTRNNEIIIHFTDEDFDEFHKTKGYIPKEKTEYQKLADKIFDKEKLYTSEELKQKMLSAYRAGKMFKTYISIDHDFEEWFKLTLI